MEKFRIKEIGFGYYVQEYSIYNFDGIPDYMWKNRARFDTEEEAREYIEYISKYISK